MLWFNHPSYVRASTLVIATLKSRRAKLKRLRLIIFLCGAKDSPRRDFVNEYLRKHTDWLTFYAEDVFKTLSEREPTANALEIEKELAELADAVILIAESAGTLAELGAFAISDELRKKLLPIADEAYEHQDSFIKTGPVRWTDKDSIFGPTIWTNLEVVLAVADEVVERIAKRISVPTSKDIRKLQIRDSKRHLLFLALLIVEIFGPISGPQIAKSLAEIVGPIPSRDITSILALGRAFKLIESVPFDAELLWFKRHGSQTLGQMKRMTPFAIASMRAQIIGAMQTIPAATSALESILGRTVSAA